MEPTLKPVNYPMAIVRDTITNELQEVTGAVLLKGKSRELTKRHVPCLIPLLTSSDGISAHRMPTNVIPTKELQSRPVRAAAARGAEKTREMAKAGHI